MAMIARRRLPRPTDPRVLDQSCEMIGCQLLPGKRFMKVSQRIYNWMGRGRELSRLRHRFSPRSAGLAPRT